MTMVAGDRCVFPLYVSVASVVRKGVAKMRGIILKELRAGLPGYMAVKSHLWRAKNKG